MPQDKNETAKLLARVHREIEPAITMIIRLTSEREADETEPVKLLEVNPETSPSGILPIAFGADLPDVPFPSVVVEVTQEEFEKISNGELQLPSGWSLGDELYRQAA